MKVLVTGATGFVGGAIVRRLGRDGEEAHVLVRDPESEEARALIAAGAHAFEGSVADPNEVLAAARECEVVVHAAAVPTHRAAPSALEWVNVAGTENVLNAARHAGVGRLVLISCADVTLENRDRIHWSEKNDILGAPLDAHARSKRLAEELVLAASGSDIECTALRPAMLWGPGDTTTLPALCVEAQSGGVHLVGRGKNLVSTTHIDNLVEAVLLAAEVEAAEGQAFYVTDGFYLDASEVYGALCKAAGLGAPRAGLPYPVAYALGAARESVGARGPWRTDVVHRGRNTLFDQQRAHSDLEYEPKLTLEDGMAGVAEWVRSVGGPEHVATLVRPPATASSVAAQIEAANAASADA